MMDKPPEKLTLPDGTVSLYRDTKFMAGTQEVRSGDHMIVQHHTGNEEDVVVVKVDGKDRVKLPRSRTRRGLAASTRMPHFGTLYKLEAVARNSAHAP